MYEKEDKRAMDLALITAKQVFELFILILCGVVIGKIKMVNEEGKGMLSNLLIYFVVPFMIINSYMSGYNAEILKNMGRMLFYSILTICIGMALSIGITFLMKKEVRRLRFVAVPQGQFGNPHLRLRRRLPLLYLADQPAAQKRGGAGAGLHAERGFRPL